MQRWAALGRELPPKALQTFLERLGSSQPASDHQAALDERDGAAGLVPCRVPVESGVLERPCQGVDPVLQGLTHQVPERPGLTYWGCKDIEETGLAPTLVEAIEFLDHGLDTLGGGAVPTKRIEDVGL
jgi:hypothetical protein